MIRDIHNLQSSSTPSKNHLIFTSNGDTLPASKIGKSSCFSNIIFVPKLNLILFRLDSWWNKISLLFSHILVVLLWIWRMGMWSPRVVKLEECSNCRCMKHLMMHIICLPVKKTSITQINCVTYDIIILDIHMLKNNLPCYNIIFILLRNHGVYHQYCLVKIVLNLKVIIYLSL